MPKKQTPTRISRDAGAELLIEATIKLARSTPIAKVGVRDIAAEAGLQTMHVKRYFGSRNELLLAVSNRLMARIMEPLADSPLPLIFPHLQKNPDVNLRLRIVSHLLDEGTDPDAFSTDQSLYIGIADRIATVNKVSKRTARTYAFIIQLVLQGSSLMGDVNGLTARQRKDIFNLLATLSGSLGSSEKTLGWK